ncbi:MAG: 50S ribosomal protein L11 methyltransferase [Sporolactobacillus sp.]
MKWSELCIHTTGEAVDSVTNILYEAGVTGVVIEDVSDWQRIKQSGQEALYALDAGDFPLDGVHVKAYLPVNSSLGESVAQIRQSLERLHACDIPLGENRLTLSERSEEEWADAWKTYYQPVRIGDRLLITPTWLTGHADDGKRVNIALDPGMAFGTGTHPTTVLCLEALEMLVRPGMHVLDVGTGSGVLAIAAAKLGAAVVDAIDLDPVAVESARRNVKQNHVEACVNVRASNLLDAVNSHYDLIVGNLLAELIVRLAEVNVAERLSVGGCFIASGIIRHKYETVVSALTAAGLCVCQTEERDDWVCLRATRHARP